MDGGAVVTAPTTLLAEARVNDVTVALTEVDGRYLLTVHDGEHSDRIEVVDTHRAVAKNRYVRVRAQLKAGKTFAWLRSLVLIFQPPEEVAA